MSLDSRCVYSSTRLVYVRATGNHRDSAIIHLAYVTQKMTLVPMATISGQSLVRLCFLFLELLNSEGTAIPKAIPIPIWKLLFNTLAQTGHTVCPLRPVLHAPDL